MVLKIGGVTVSSPSGGWILQRVSLSYKKTESAESFHVNCKVNSFRSLVLCLYATEF